MGNADGRYGSSCFGLILSALLAILPGITLAETRQSSQGTAGTVSFHGSMGIETENYQFDSEYVNRERTRLSTRFDLNGRGFIWDPRFALFDAGVTLQNESVQIDESGTAGSSNYNILGYRLNSSWFSNKPYQLTLYANRDRSTVSDFWSPSYALTTNNVGARWGMENRLLGRSTFYVDQTRSESDSSVVPHSNKSTSFGFDSSQKIKSQDFGESDFTYGYRHSSWSEKVYSSSQRQDSLYINDRSLFGENTNLTTNLTAYDRRDQWGTSGWIPIGNVSGVPIVSEMNSKFAGLNSMLNVQQTDDFRHFYGLGFSMSDTGSSKSVSKNISGGSNYRIDEHWQISETLGMNGTNTELSANSYNSTAQTQDSTSFFGNASLMYTDSWEEYQINAGYILALMESDIALESGQSSQFNTTHTANIGYARMNSPLYTDSLQLRLSKTVGEPRGNETNIRYTVISTLSQNDMLQGTAEYRRYVQRVAPVTININTTDYAYYNGTNSQSSRLDFGWLHRLSETGSLMLSAGITEGQSQDVAINTSYVQARASINPARSLLLTALVRAELVDGSMYIAGKKITAESDLNYRIGKWQATVRYRYRDIRQEFLPFIEHSIALLLKRDFDFRL